MSQKQNKALLPAGLRDILPPEAEREAKIREALADTFSTHGYERVKPPLIEFEEGLISGAGAAMSGDTFRLMDPISQHMMGIRADMTTQVARIAMTRLQGTPRPLRLSYTGEVLRVRGTQLRPERQFAQVGAELIGSDSAAADVEIIGIAIESLRDIGVPKLSVDLTIPSLIPALLGETDSFGDDQSPLRDALDRKDASSVKLLGKEYGDVLCHLINSTGLAKDALNKLCELTLPPNAASELDRLKAVVQGITDHVPQLKVTIDPVENRGFEYHTGVGYTLFSLGERGEIGSGGRYLAKVEETNAEKYDTEPATGFTLYVDTILRVLPDLTRARRIFIPSGTEIDELRDLRWDGWITVGELDPTNDKEAEAQRLNCTHIFKDGKPVPVVKGLSS